MNDIMAKVRRFETLKLALGTLILAVGSCISQIGCLESVDATYGGADEVIETDTGTEQDTSTPTTPDVEPDTGTTITPYVCQDLDNDGICANSPEGAVRDCNDSPNDLDGNGVVDGFSINPVATEICDGLDNDCDGKTDEGLATTASYKDEDGDGFGAGAAVQNCGLAGYVLQAGDCDDGDPDVYPGATDVTGDGIDSDCDDEPTQAEVEYDLTIWVGYGNAAHRIMSVQVYTNEADLGAWWSYPDAVVSDAEDIFYEGNLDEDTADDIVGIRFNIAQGSPASQWLCEGNGDTAMLAQDTDIEVVFFGEVYSLEDITPWSDPSGSGCSALLDFSPDDHEFVFRSPQNFGG